MDTLVGSTAPWCSWLRGPAAATAGVLVDEISPQYGYLRCLVSTAVGLLMGEAGPSIFLGQELLWKGVYSGWGCLPVVVGWELLLGGC